jgi:hypothetical protein
MTHEEDKAEAAKQVSKDFLLGYALGVINDAQTLISKGRVEQAINTLKQAQEYLIKMPALFIMLLNKKI